MISVNTSQHGELLGRLERNVVVSVFQNSDTMIKDLEHLVREFNTEDYRYICNTAILSIQFAIEFETVDNPGHHSRIHHFLTLFRSECETILRMLKVLGNSVKNSKLMARKINLHFEMLIEGYLVM